jgi:hypothetical protein
MKINEFFKNIINFPNNYFNFVNSEIKLNKLIEKDLKDIDIKITKAFKKINIDNNVKCIINNEEFKIQILQIIDDIMDAYTLNSILNCKKKLIILYYGAYHILNMVKILSRNGICEKIYHNGMKTLDDERLESCIKIEKLNI